MITQKKTANAVGGKTARACESCLKKRAGWFCPADDAFLCNACDLLVHSANELAGRHKRVRLGIASSKTSSYAPSWHQGFTKKARTPRNPKAKPYHNNYNNYNNTYHVPVVPEVSNDDNDNDNFSVEENEENDMGFSVPTFNFNNNERNCNKINDDEVDDEFNISLIGFDGDEWNNMPGFLPSENELAEFAADVESLLEQEEAVKMEEDDDLIIDDLQGGKNNLHVCFPGVKIEDEGESNSADHCYFDWSIDVESEMLNFDLNYNCVNDESQLSGGEEEEEKKVVVPFEENLDENNLMDGKKRRKILLRLNYEEVINEWSNLGCSSPWTTGRRPEFDLNHDGWPNCMGAFSPTGVHQHGRAEWVGIRGNVHGGDGGREARVSRYREKRRTRLFSKKIRYEVRKLNAEKRPRLKGRFVKRTSLSSPLSPYLNK